MCVLRDKIAHALNEVIINKKKKPQCNSNPRGIEEGTGRKKTKSNRAHLRVITPPTPNLDDLSFHRDIRKQLNYFRELFFACRKLIATWPALHFYCKMLNTTYNTLHSPLGV